MAIVHAAHIAQQGAHAQTYKKQSMLGRLKQYQRCLLGAGENVASDTVATDEEDIKIREQRIDFFCFNADVEQA